MIDPNERADAQVVITKCSHLFCHACASKHFADRAVCPACQDSITQSELRSVFLNPNATELQMLLWGMSPSSITEIAQSAVGFFEYQKRQEINYLQHMLNQQNSEQQNGEIKAREKLDYFTQQNAELVERIKRMQNELNAKDMHLSTMQKDVEDKDRQLKRWAEQRLVSQPQIDTQNRNANIMNAYGNPQQAQQPQRTAMALDYQPRASPMTRPQQHEFAAMPAQPVASPAPQHNVYRPQQMQQKPSMMMMGGPLSTPVPTPSRYAADQQPISRQPSKFQSTKSPATIFQGRLQTPSQLYAQRPSSTPTGTTGRKNAFETQSSFFGKSQQKSAFSFLHSKQAG
jgi:hypothetical protein